MRSLCAAVCFFVLSAVYSDENTYDTLSDLLNSKQIPFYISDVQDDFDFDFIDDEEDAAKSDPSSLGNIVVELGSLSGNDTDKLLVLLANSSFPWIDNVLLSYIEYLILNKAYYEAMVIFYNDKTHILSGAELDKIESKEKAVVIMLDVADVPVKIHIQGYKGGKKPPLGIAQALFETCDNNDISIAFTSLKNNVVQSAYDFPFLILGGKKNNSASFRTRMAGDEKDISKDSMLNMLLEFSDSVMSNPNTDYDTYYISINFFGIQLFLPSIIWIKILLFGLPLVSSVIFFLCKIKVIKSTIELLHLHAPKIYG